MTDTCRITRPSTAEPVFDHDLGRHVPAPPDVVYGPGVVDMVGRCQVSPDRRQDRVAEMGGDKRRLSHYTLSLPAGAEPAEGDTVELLSSATDPTLVGRRFTISGEPEHKTLLMKRTAPMVLERTATTA